MKFRALLALLAALAIFATACGSDDIAQVTGEVVAESTEVEAAPADEPEPAEEVVEDEVVEEEAIEEEVMAEEPADAVMAEESAAPQRIVSLNPTGTEMLFAVGAGDQVVAVDNFSYYPPEAPVVDDLSAYTPSVEAIAAFEPDLIVTSAPIEGLDVLGVDVLQLDAAATLDDVYAQIEQVGAATGHVGDAAELVLEMQTDIDAVLASLPERETPLTYYHELDNTFYSVTSSTFIGQVYSLLGLENVADAADPDGEFFGYPQMNEEFLFAADPDVIFLADTLCCDQSAVTVAARPGWADLRAVQNGAVIELNDDVASRWGPRIVEFIETAGAVVVDLAASPSY